MISIDDILRVLHRFGYLPLGVLFFDPKTRCYGIADFSDAPDAMIEEIGQRIGGPDAQMKRIDA